MNTLILRFLPYVIVFLLAFGGYKYVEYLKQEINILKENVTILKANLITQKSKCEEDIAIEKANMKIKTKIKYVNKYIERVKENEVPDNDKFMLFDSTVQ